MSHEPETPESEFVRKWRHDGNATMIQAVQIIATLTAERDALRTALEFYGEQRNYRAAAGSNQCADHDHRGYCEMSHTDAYDSLGLPGARAREALGGKS